jgi:hypothetical protein
MYGPDEFVRIEDLLEAYVARHWLLLVAIFGGRSQQVVDDALMEAPATIAVLERLEARPLSASRVWRQEIGTVDELERLGSLAGYSLGL